jgi:RNA polymerase sigma factor (sigma-70 family)
MPQQPMVPVEACARAFEEQSNFVRGVLVRLGVRKTDAEDLAQEVFLVMWRRWADYDRKRPLRPWLAGIALRIAYDHQRKRSTSETPHARLDLPDVAPRPDEQLATEGARRLVLRALAELSAKHQVLLVLHELDEVPVEALATRLGLPKDTIYSRLRRARFLFARAVRRLQLLGHDTHR